MQCEKEWPKRTLQEIKEHIDPFDTFLNKKGLVQPSYDLGCLKVSIEMGKWTESVVEN